MRSNIDGENDQFLDTLQFRKRLLIQILSSCNAGGLGLFITSFTGNKFCPLQDHYLNAYSMILSIFFF